MANQQWYFARNDRMYGPYTSAQMKQLAASGKLRHIDMVQAGTGRWLPASQVRGLFPATSPAGPPPVPARHGVAAPPPLPAKGPPPPPADASLPACRAPRLAAVQVAVDHTADSVLIRVKGEAETGGAGELLDGLLAPAAQHPTAVILDLSELRSLSGLAAGVLAAYCRSVARTGGRVRLAGVLQPAVKESLVRAKLSDLFGAIAASAASGPAPGGPSAAARPSSSARPGSRSAPDGQPARAGAGAAPAPGRGPTPTRRRRVTRRPCVSCRPTTATRRPRQRRRALQAGLAVVRPR
jgi:anti-anti-sigma factor